MEAMDLGAVDTAACEISALYARNLIRCKSNTKPHTYDLTALEDDEHEQDEKKNNNIHQTENIIDFNCSSRVPIKR